MLSGSQGPRNVNWIDGGNRYHTCSSTRKQRAWRSGLTIPPLVLIPWCSTTNHTFPGSSANFQYESFQWSENSEYILFQSNFRPVYRYSGISDYYYYSLEENTLRLVAEDARTAELSPDGNKVGFERGGDLYVYNLENGQEKLLTNSAQEKIYNGRFRWVYEEEFGLVQAWSWSPDSKYIAFWQTNEREVPMFQTTDFEGQHPEYMRIPYPKVGDTNSTFYIGSRTEFYVSDLLRELEGATEGLNLNLITELEINIHYLLHTCL